MASPLTATDGQITIGPWGHLYKNSHHCRPSILPPPSPPSCLKYTLSLYWEPEEEKTFTISKEEAKQGRAAADHNYHRCRARFARSAHNLHTLYDGSCSFGRAGINCKVRGMFGLCVAVDVPRGSTTPPCQGQPGAPLSLRLRLYLKLYI